LKNYAFIFLLVIFIFGCASNQNKDNNKSEKEPDVVTEEKTDEAAPTEVESVSTEPAMTADENDSICEGLASWEQECHERIENFVIKKYSDLVSRDGETLKLSIENGEDLIFMSNSESMSPENFVRYSLFNYYPAIDAYNILVTYYEGKSNRLINRKSGKSIDVVGDIAVSPNQKRFVVYNKDLETTYTFNGFYVFKVDGNNYVQEHKEGLQWGPGNAKWLSNTKIEFEKIIGPPFEVEGKAVYELVGDKWVAQ
jgi:hypothetical protein